MKRTAPRLTAGAVALALLPFAAGCGGNDSKPQSSAGEQAAQPASGTLQLDSEQQAQFEKARQQIAAFCADKHKSAEPVGSIAIAESLLDFGKNVRTAGGSTLGAQLTQSRDQLSKCGAKGLAKRLTKALN